MEIDLTLWDPLVAALVPILVALAVRLAAYVGDRWRIPKWVVPTVLAPTLGAALQAVLALIAAGDIDPVKGIVLGGLAVFLREITDKLRKAGSAWSYGDPADRMP